MKKNLISVIILALCFANLVLTGLLLFTVLPETKKANALIDSVCQAIDLDLNSGASNGLSNVPLDQIESYSVNGGESMNINLKSDGGSNHYAVITVSLSLNIESDNYVKYSPTVLATKEDIIMKKSYKIEVDCANCANKMEEAAKNTAGVKDAVVNFMALKMNVEFEDGADVKAVMQDVLKNCNKVEDDCEIYL